MQRTRESTIASAVEKAKSEINATSAAAPNTEIMTKKHVQEIQALRAEHEAALKAAVETVAAGVKSETTNDHATKAAIAARNKEIQARHAEEISAAVERGRMEQVAKSKLKDAQLVRSQNKLKELEAQVMEWRKAGLIPDATAAAPVVAVPTTSAAPTITPTTPVASTSKIPLTSATPAASASTTAPAPAASTSAPAATPAVPPSSSAPVGPVRRALGGAVPLSTTEGVGRGRGAPRGRGRGISIRGAAPSHGGTGPAPTAATAAAASTTTTVGVQIMGAANKRGREDETTQPDDSLAKRLKPAGEGTAAGGAAASSTATAGGSKPPVAIRRPPPS